MASQQLWSMSSRFPLFRLQKMKIAVEDPPGRKHLVFQGAAAIAKMTMNSSGYWVTQQDYKEEGVDRLVARLNKFGGQHK